MKKIILVLLVVILIVVVYGKYQQHKRFSKTEMDYKISEQVDLNYRDKSVIYQYFEAVEDLNTFVLLQYKANKIDVRAPKDDKVQTREAVIEYGNKRAKVKYYETLLEQSKKYKDSMLTNTQINAVETGGSTMKNLWKQQKAKSLVQMLSLQTNATLRPGETGPIVFEIQKLLVSKGKDIKIDGYYRIETKEAVKWFEEQNNLYPDGILDLLTLHKLLE